MSQYCRPEAVLVPSPVTLVGPAATGFLAVVVVLCVVVVCVPLCAPTTPVSPATAIPNNTLLVVIQSSVRNVCSGQRDHVNFNQDIFRKARDFDRGAGWRGSVKVLPVRFIHGCEIVHVLEKHRGANDLFKAGASGFQDPREILNHALSLKGHVTAEQRVGAGIERNLAGDKDKAIGFDGLRIGSDGGWTIFGYDYVAHESSKIRLWALGFRL